MSRPLRLTYLFTTFPKSTETFLQREVTAMRARGVQVRLYSLWGGGGEYEGVPVTSFNKWRLLTLVWMIPWVAVRYPRFFGTIFRGLLTRRPPSWLNFWENMLGAGFAAFFRSRIKAEGADWIHAAWGGAPATAAWCLQQMDGVRFSSGAHAYDLYEHGGDWWLEEKLRCAAFIHTSTEMGRRSLLERGLAEEKIFVIRRGLARWPELKSLRQDRSPLRVLSVARLVEKKGFPHQLEIYRTLRDAGVNFTAVVVGDGPLRAELEAQTRRLGLTEHVSWVGHLAQEDVWRKLAWADVLLHTGVVARSGDRDGLPNVIPEAMAAGVLVVTSPAAATTEAIADGVTGWVIPVEKPNDWAARLRTMAEGRETLTEVQAAARAWVEREFNAHRNAERLHALFLQAAAP